MNRSWYEGDTLPKPAFDSFNQWHFGPWYNEVDTIVPCKPDEPFKLGYANVNIFRFLDGKSASISYEASAVHKLHRWRSIYSPGATKIASTFGD